ncbi:hypothetical protein N9546_02785 [Flavobacteriaceae bacterium]|nr:hypothetical protein [Flavobacteriaceae bacterium]
MKKLLILLLFIPLVSFGQKKLIIDYRFQLEDFFIAAFGFSVLTLVLAYLISRTYKRINSNIQQRNIKIIYCVFAILAPLIVVFYNVFFIEPILKAGPVKGKIISLYPFLFIFSFLTYIITGFILYRLKKIKKTVKLSNYELIVQFILASLLFLILIFGLYGILTAFGIPTGINSYYNYLNI